VDVLSKFRPSCLGHSWSCYISGYQPVCPLPLLGALRYRRIATPVPSAFHLLKPAACFGRPTDTSPLFLSLYPLRLGIGPPSASSRSHSVFAVTRLQVSSPDFRPLMLTVFTGHPDGTTLRSEPRGWSSPADPATLIAVLPHSRATGPLYISAGLLPAAVVSLETFVPELRGQVSFEHASFFQPCRQRLRLAAPATHLAQRRSEEPTLPKQSYRVSVPAASQRWVNVFSSPPATVQTTLPCGSFGLSGFTCQTSFAFFRQLHAVADTEQMLLPGLTISFRCRTSLAGRLRYARPLHPCGSRRFRNAVLQSLPQSERCPFEQRPLHSLDCRNLVVTTDFSALLPALPRSRTLGLV